MGEETWYEYSDVYDKATGVLWHYKYQCRTVYFSDGKPVKECVLVYKWR